MSGWGQVAQSVADQTQALRFSEETEEESVQLEGMSSKELKALATSVDKMSFADFPHLLGAKPREGYVFRSDYFTVDEEYGCIMGFFHDESSADKYAPFWGVSRIPYLRSNVTAVFFEQVTRMSEKWIKDNIRDAERVDNTQDRENKDTDSKSARSKNMRVSEALQQVIDEVNLGAAYLMVHDRLLLRAPSLEILDEAVDDIRYQFIDNLGSLNIAPHHGEQRRELSSLLSPLSMKRGKGFSYPSSEFAGTFHLVTNGLNDHNGEYVGYMVGDVNNAAVLMDVNRYSSHVVIADDDKSRAQAMKNSYVADMWGSKVSQACLIDGGRVVHIVLDGAELMGTLGPKMSSITTVMDMNRGDINMFEIFGDREDQLSLFSAHIEKVTLMVGQAYAVTDAERAIVRSALQKTLKRFYVDHRMWMEDAANNVDRLRVVGIPHNEVPKLATLVAYLEQERKALINASARDDQELHAYSVLSGVLRNMLDINADLFNMTTNSIIDNVSESRRVIYDFSSLMQRGKHLAMAQLINVIGFATAQLGEGDSLIIHGAENITSDQEVREYLHTQIDALKKRSGRVVFCYNSIEKMLENEDLNKFITADWTAFGAMSDTLFDKYRSLIKKDMPVGMQQLITDRGKGYTFLRRGITNVVFRRDLALGIKIGVQL